MRYSLHFEMSFTLTIDGWVGEETEHISLMIVSFYTSFHYFEQIMNLLLSFSYFFGANNFSLQLSPSLSSLFPPLPLSSSLHPSLSPNFSYHYPKLSLNIIVISLSIPLSL